MSLLKQGIQLFRLLVTQPASIKAAASWRPFSITAFQMARSLREQAITPSTVIDGGANVGQFARAMLEIFPQTRVFSFEPLPDAAQKFRSRFEKENRCTLIQKALGDSDGMIEFHPQQYDLASSVLLPVDGTTSGSIEVPITCLDTALATEALDEPILLKLDLQGYELEALRGGVHLLTKVRWVLIEVSFRPTYAGEATFPYLYDLLWEHGFRFLRPIDTLADKDGEIVQMDALFEKVN